MNKREGILLESTIGEFTVTFESLNKSYPYHIKQDGYARVAIVGLGPLKDLRDALTELITEMEHNQRS